MNTINYLFSKIAGQTKKMVLIGAAVVGLSLMSYASVAEEKAGPTKDKLEAVQLQTIQQSIDVVVAAIGKVDPEWVKGLPKLKGVKKAKAQTDHYYLYTGDTNEPGDIQNPANWTYLDDEEPTVLPCDGEDEVMCVVRLPVDEEDLEDYIEDLIFEQLENDERIESFREIQ